MTIIARWEWRTFGVGLFLKPEEVIRGFGMESHKRTEELYILSEKSDENIKIRFDVIDVKSLQNINKDKLEQWMPILKTGFPVPEETLKNLFKIFKVDEPQFERREYEYEQFIDEIIMPCKDLKIVEVKKSREIYKIEGTTVEIAETEFNGKPWRTICVEHENPALVTSVVEKLGLTNLHNINYIQAMKKSVGMI